MQFEQRAIFVGHLADDIHPSTDEEPTTFRILTDGHSESTNRISESPRTYEVVVRDHLKNLIKDTIPAGSDVLVEGRILNHKFGQNGPQAESVTRVRLEAFSVLAYPTDRVSGQSKHTVF